jgi:hypothetical protein
MNYYELVPDDQPWNNWLLFTEHKEPPYVVAEAAYSDCICPKCGKIDHDKAFRIGFEKQRRIRAKGDLLATSEGFYCLSDRAKRVLESERLSGITLKPIPGAGWWVIDVSRRVEADQSAYTLTKPLCDYCGRPKEAIGLIRCLNQVRVPNQIGTFFSPVFDRAGSMNCARDVFVTEDIVSLFKRQKLKGAMFARLLTPTEFAAIKAAGAEKDPLKWPKDSRVVL